MLALAFQTDSTRVATLLLGHDGDNRSLPEIGIAEGHHDLSHHFNSEEKIQKLSDIDRWYAQQFARFLQKLRDTTDVDGRSLLHNSMILYGSGNADGNRHTHSNLPLILAGGGGGAFSTGRYVQHGGKPMTNLLLRMADEMGAQPGKVWRFDGRFGKRVALALGHPGRRPGRRVNAMNGTIIFKVNGKAQRVSTDPETNLVGGAA